MECDLIIISLSVACVMIGIKILQTEHSSRPVMPKGKASNQDGKESEKSP